jgi:hypothetical protein
MVRPALAKPPVKARQNLYPNQNGSSGPGQTPGKRTAKPVPEPEWFVRAPAIYPSKNPNVRNAAGVLALSR